jgi:hypothetical protein
MLYGAYLIPFLAAAVMLIFFHKRTKWWELGIPFLAATVLIVGFKYAGEWSATKDGEFWGGWVVEAQYYEAWNEYIHQTCTRTVSCGKDCTTTESYDCSYVDYHSEYWQVNDSNGAGNVVSESSYDHFVKLYGKRPSFVDMHRSYHTNDGDMYKTVWPKTEATFEEVFTEHSYENRVQASRSVFSYRHIEEEEVATRGLFTYPEKVSLFDFPSVLGDCGAGTEAANKRLQYHNAKLGRAKQVRMWMLCTDSGDPSFGQDQESLWVGGNKNEVVLVKGQGWVHVFSWTDHKEPIIETRDHVAQMGTFDPVEAVDFMAGKVGADFERKHFEDFSYLTVETPTWTIWTTWILVALFSGGICWWNVVNDFHDDDTGRRFRTMRIGRHTRRY